MSEPEEWTAARAAASLRVPQLGNDKYSRGVLGVRTGSLAYPGAAVLGVEAAWRTGLGMVRYVGPETVGARVLTLRPETVLGEGRVQAWLIGSGTDAAHRGRAETQTIAGLLDGAVPVIVDAGALDLVAGTRGGAPLVLTPHDREFARLEATVGISSSHPDALAARVAATRTLATRLGHVVLRKGSTTIVAAPSGWCATVSAGTPWLATAGTGDVLGGVIGALVAAHTAHDPDSLRGGLGEPRERGGLGEPRELGRSAAFEPPAALDTLDNLDTLGALAATGAWLHGVAGRIAAGLVPVPASESVAGTATHHAAADGVAGDDAASGRPITALDVAHALPAAVASALAFARRN